VDASTGDNLRPDDPIIWQVQHRTGHGTTTYRMEIDAANCTAVYEGVVDDLALIRDHPPEGWYRLRITMRLVSSELKGAIDA
jgi:hypothetical protein